MLKMQFFGNIEAKMDTKARVFVPAAFRKILQSSTQNAFIIRKDIFQNCLVLYPLLVWEAEIAELRSRLNRWDKEQQALFRQFVIDAERLEMDSNGRILLPKNFLVMSGIRNELVFLGIGNSIELWTREALDKTRIPADDFSKQLEERMNNNPEKEKE